VVPKDSSWFSYLPWGSLDPAKIQPMNETEIYHKDLIGLKTLDEQNKIVFKEYEVTAPKWAIIIKGNIITFE
jgi:hypothetical protein